MANQWFRMYAEFLHDPKVQMLSESDQRRYIMLLCLRCSNGDTPLHETFQDESIAFQLRIDTPEWLSTKGVLISKGLIDNDIEIVAWSKRQYVSDTSTARVRKHRESKKIDIETQCNVSVTAPDTDTDTDTDIKTPCSTGGIDITGKQIDIAVQEKKKVLADRFTAFWSAYPKKENKHQTDKCWLKISPSEDVFNKIMSSLARAKKSDQWVKDGGRFIPLASTWLNQRRWEDEIQDSGSSVVAMPKKYRLNHLGIVEEFATYGGISGWSVTEFHSIEDYENSKRSAA